MNGELYQLSRIVLYVKEILYSNQINEFKKGEYEEQILYEFAPTKRLIFSETKKSLVQKSGAENL